MLTFVVALNCGGKTAQTNRQNPKGGSKKIIFFAGGLRKWLGEKM
jgi:hypothetical protein